MTKYPLIVAVLAVVTVACWSDHAAAFGRRGNRSSTRRFTVCSPQASGCHCLRVGETNTVGPMAGPLGILLEDAKGSCKYPVGIGGTICKPNLTKAQCDKFEDSSWEENGKCP